MRRFWFLSILLLIILVLVSACAAATQAPAAEERTVVVKETQAVEVTKEVEVTVAPALTQPPAQQPTATPHPAGLETPFPTRPVVQPAASPTPGAVPTEIVEARLVELEWPASMRLGDSDLVRLSLVPSTEGYIVQPDFPEHQTYTQTLQVRRPTGYELSGIARLEGVGFRISPQGDQERLLPIGEKVTWQWSLSPLSPGQQRLFVTLWLRWTPQQGIAGQLRETEIYARGLEVQVRSFFGMTRQQAMTGGVFGLVFGGGLSLFGMAGLFNPARRTLLFENPNPALVIEPRPGLSLQPSEGVLLRSLFNRYARLVLESEFLSGYSGARTFLALPIRPDGGADAHTIVKIGERQAIRREYENYEQFVRDTLPPITARIQRPPVTARLSEQAALQYTFIGAPGQTPSSLRQALLQEPDPALLLKLFETFGPNWWMQRRPYVFRLALEYDRVLPTHLVVAPEKGHGRSLDGRMSSDEASFQVGELVTLRNFPTVERRFDGRSLALTGKATPGLPPLRLRWLGLADPNGASGRVVTTRLGLLQESAAGFDRLGLPDPLERLPERLRETVNGTQSTIHGDLNLENILVGLGDFVWLIDFATTRKGHTLFDFAHLGAELIAHILAPKVESPVDFLSGMQAVYPDAHPAPSPAFELLKTIQEISSRCLFNSSQPREFHLALYMSCLGALKYVNLQANQKHLLYLAAAYLSQLL